MRWPSTRRPRGGTRVTQAPEKFVGGGVLRKEDPALVTGRATWTDNIKLPGMLHAVFMRSPYAHAKITSIDVSAAWGRRRLYRRRPPRRVREAPAGEPRSRHRLRPEPPRSQAGPQRHGRDGRVRRPGLRRAALVRLLDRPRGAQDPAPRPASP